MPPKLIVTQFFQLMVKRDFARAERLIDQIKEKVSNAQWNQGFILALKGMLMAYRSNDSDAFINRIQPNKLNAIRLKNVFQPKAQNLIGSEFNRGFFAAWVDFTHFLINSNFHNFTKQREGINATKNMLKEDKPIVEKIPRQDR